MLTRSTGNTAAIFEDLAAMVAAGSPNNRRLELYDGTRYQTSAVDDGGVLLSTGNYANPLAEYVIPQTVSGILTAGGKLNQIRDSGAFTMPLANSVDTDTILVVELPKKYAAQTPSLTRSGGDSFEDDAGTDTVISWLGAARLTLTSDGVSKWSL